MTLTGSLNSGIRARWLAVTVACLGGASPALAAEYLTDVTSEIYQAAGTPKELATRATTCISQNLAPGTTDAQLIISSDLDGGTVVARNVMQYGALAQWRIRSKFTFEARNGRFRITQTGLERLNSTGGGWLPIGKWAGSGWQKAQDTFLASALTVAQCVTKTPTKADW